MFLVLRGIESHRYLCHNKQIVIFDDIASANIFLSFNPKYIEFVELYFLENINIPYVNIINIKGDYKLSFNSSYQKIVYLQHAVLLNIMREGEGSLKNLEEKLRYLSKKDDFSHILNLFFDYCEDNDLYGYCNIVLNILSELDVKKTLSLNKLFEDRVKKHENNFTELSKGFLKCHYCWYNDKNIYNLTNTEIIAYLECL